MKTNVTVALLVLLTSILFFGPHQWGGFSKYLAASQEQTGKTRSLCRPAYKAACCLGDSRLVPPSQPRSYPGRNYLGRRIPARVADDPTLHSFFGSCDVEPTMQPLPDDILVFMAFRRGQEIKWTRRPLVVHKGEYVLTFCGKTVLARCGNLISWTPMQPSEDVPPSFLEAPVEEMPKPQASDHPAPSYLASQPAEAPAERVTLTRALGVVESIDGAYGIKIVKLTQGSPAANAGLLAGDTVLALDGVTVKTERALDAQFAKREAGSRMIATIMHGGWAYDVTITKPDVHTVDHSLGLLFPGHTVKIGH